MEAMRTETVGFSDEQLMRRTRDGDDPSLGLLFERHHRPLYNFFLRWLGRPDVAEDLVQEVFFRMLKYKHSYREDKPFAAWMFTIAHNVGKDHLAKYGDCFAPLEETRLQDPVDPVRGLNQQVEWRRLTKAFARLDPEKRRLLVLCRFHNLGYRQIGEMLGCSVGAVKVRLHRALMELKDRFFQVNKEKVS